MRKRTHKILAVLMALILCLSSAVASLEGSFVVAAAEDATEDSSEAAVTILYTNDVHSYITQDLTYSMVAGYRDTLENVLLVDAGDHIQGTAYGSMDSGYSIIQIMNAAGYDLATLGNHEFDYGMEGALNAMEWADFPYVSCNFYHMEDGEVTDNVLDSYQIFEVNSVTIAMIGITTPESISKSTPKYFQNEDGNYIYGIAGGTDGTELYEAVQAAIDEVRDEADYVIALGHLGIDLSSVPWTSEEVIANTTGLDAFIDGHSHSTVEMETVEDAEGNDVILTQTGSYLAALGQLTISEDGTITTELLTAEDLEDVTPNAEVAAVEEAWIAQVDEELGAKIASSEIYFTVNDSDGNRAIRKSETNVGDFNADAYYWYLNEKEGLDCDLAIMNGGGIRENVEAGDWTYLTCKMINPFNNVICMVEVTGQVILDCLEYGSRYTDTVEAGGFMQVAGVTYEIDLSVESSIPTDENGTWIGSPEEYRVKNVKVYNKETGEYEDLDLEKTYTIAGTNYTLRNCGGGFDMFADSVLVKDYISEDYMALAAYALAFADTDGDGYADISSESSPLAAYSGYVINYEDISGAGRITLLAAAGEEQGETGTGEETETEETETVTEEETEETETVTEEETEETGTEAEETTAEETETGEETEEAEAETGEITAEATDTDGTAEEETNAATGGTAAQTGDPVPVTLFILLVASFAAMGYLEKKKKRMCE